MSVAGINGTANYPVYTPGKATGKVSNNNFSQQINHAKAGNVHTFADTVKQTREAILCRGRKHTKII